MPRVSRSIIRWFISISCWGWKNGGDSSAVRGRAELIRLSRHGRGQLRRDLVHFGGVLLDLLVALFMRAAFALNSFVGVLRRGVDVFCTPWPTSRRTSMRRRCPFTPWPTSRRSSPQHAGRPGRVQIGFGSASLALWAAMSMVLAMAFLLELAGELNLLEAGCPGDQAVGDGKAALRLARDPAPPELPRE